MRNRSSLCLKTIESQYEKVKYECKKNIEHHHPCKVCHKKLFYIVAVVIECRENTKQDGKQDWHDKICCQLKSIIQKNQKSPEKSARGFARFLCRR